MLIRIAAASAALLALLTSAEAPAQASERNQSLEEIVVTAQKREQSQQKVPVSVTTLGADFLEERGIFNFLDLRATIPNIVIDSVPGGSNTATTYLRGIGSDNPVFTGDAGVATYVDDVYIARAQGAMFDLYDIERIEVLRGPQGTLYGRNSSGGAIKYVSAKPDLDNIDAHGNVTVGNYDTFNARGAINVPLVEGRTGVRAAFFTRNRDGFMTNLRDGSEADDYHATGGRLHIRHITDGDIDILFTGELIRERSVPAPGADFADNPDGDLRTFFSELDVRQGADVTSGTVNVRIPLGDYELRSVTNYRDLGWFIQDDVDGQVVSRFEPNQRLLNRQYSQEFNLSGSAGNVDWVLGAFYLFEHNDFLWDLTVLGNLGVPQVFTRFNQDTDALGVFANANWRLTDRLTLTTGLRWSDETKDYTAIGFNETAPNVVAGGDPQGTLSYVFEAEADFGEPQWKLALDYQWTDDLMTFISAARGYRSGGFNGGARSLAEAQQAPFEEEFVTTYEVGMKSEWLDRRLRFNATYFYSDFENIQEAVLTQDEFGTVTADATIQGIELELTALPVDNFELTASLGTLDNEVEQLDRELKRVPDLSYRLGGTYDFPMADGGAFFVGAEVIHSDEFFINVENQASVGNPGFDLVNARIGYRAADGRWRAELGGRNLTDENFSQHGFDLVIPGLGPLSQVIFPNAPRTWYLTLSYSL